MKEKLGITTAGEAQNREDVIRYINLKLAGTGQPFYEGNDFSSLGMMEGIIKNTLVKNRLNEKVPAAIDQRIESFVNGYLSDVINEPLRLPENTLVLDQYGLAREMSLPPDQTEFHTNIIESYRIGQGVLHNPKNDRRTTKGVFHVVEDGLPIPDDKKAVPREVFAKFFSAAFNEVPEELMQLPFTASQEKKAELFVSLLLKPEVCPEVPGYSERKYMEVRFFAPGNLVANLDFVESIFANAGNPYLPENDSALDPKHWTGTTGCVILAPQLLKKTKKELGLPNIADATERQVRDGMCWEKEDELYNDGQPFKITCRNEQGIIVTIITDNYFGYCKKEVKTQIGYSANLFGLAEEEHAGGALVFPSYNLAGSYKLKDENGYSIEDLPKYLGDSVEILANGYGIDKNRDDVVYVPGGAEFVLAEQRVKWLKNGSERTLKIHPGITYISPSGYKVEMQKHPDAPTWRLVGTVAEGTLCHKPSTVSGGGKSEISKSLLDATYSGPVFINNFSEDMKAVQEIIDFDYGNRLINPPDDGTGSRDLLDLQRSLGSVIKLLTPSELFTEEYNQWLDTIPNNIKAIVFSVKRFYKEEWGSDWQSHFSVDEINGESAHELKFEGRKIVGSYLRVAKESDGSWRTFKLRQDFLPADKIQWEDDITASITVPADRLTGLSLDNQNPSVKIAQNCEFRFFQRPDDAIIRGYDKQAEIDLSGENNFISNFQPLNNDEIRDIVEDVVSFNDYTEPMKNRLAGALTDDETDFVISSAHPRIVNGAPTKNPRYLQVRPDLLNDKPNYLAEVSTRLKRQAIVGTPVHHPVNAVLPGRRNNPAEPGIRPLAVFGPVHYQDLPELFMDFMSSLTGKSPSTTGAGSEGALTKGPFNALLPVTDLNNALLGLILSDYNAFSTAAGYIGHHYKVDHDISLLVPEIWSRLSVEERTPKFLIDNGYLEKVEDFEYNGETIMASRLGYRITRKFATTFLGRIFDQPSVVFPDDMLKPEEQSLEYYVDGIKNICEAHAKTAAAYFRDGGVEGAIPPLKAILHILVEGEYEGKTIDHPEIRALFDRESVLASDWYKARLEEKIDSEKETFETFKTYIESFIADKRNTDITTGMDLEEELAFVKGKIADLEKGSYVEKLVGTIGKDILKK